MNAPNTPPEHGRVCAIIINYFGADRTRRCLESLREQPLDRLILVDNSATPTERSAMRLLVRNLVRSGASFPIGTLFNDANLGFGAAVNRAITQDLLDQHGHDYYLLMNNDAVAEPGLVATLVRTALTDQRPALVSPRIRWGKAEIGAHWYQPWLGHISHSAFPGAFPYLTGCCLLVDRALLCKDGRLFDEAFFMYGEDVELNLRAQRHGREAACVDQMLVIHEGSGSSAHGAWFYEYHVARCHVLLANRLARNRVQGWAFISGRILYLGARALVRALRYRRLAPLRAYFACWGSTVGTPLSTPPSQHRTAKTSSSSTDY